MGSSANGDWMPVYHSKSRDLLVWPVFLLLVCYTCCSYFSPGHLVSATTQHLTLRPGWILECLDRTATSAHPLTPKPREAVVRFQSKRE